MMGLFVGYIRVPRLLRNMRHSCVCWLKAVTSLTMSSWSRLFVLTTTCTLLLCQMQRLLENGQGFARLILRARQGKLLDVPASRDEDILVEEMYKEEFGETEVDLKSL